MSLRHWRALAALVVASVVPAAGLVRPHAIDPQSTERTLTVDFYALANDGTPVIDLKVEELTVRVNSRARQIRSLRLVTQASPPPQNRLEPVLEAPPAFVSNRAGRAGRTFIIAVDDESFRPGRERPIRSAVGAFLGGLNPQDHLSLWTMPHGGLKVNLTTNHDRLKEAVDLVSGHAAQSESASEAACRTRNTLEALEHMLASITGGEGPVTVMFFTGGLFGPQRDAGRTGPPGMCEVRQEHFQRVGYAAAQARAHFHIIQPEDLQRGPTNAADTLAGAGFVAGMNPLEGMEHLAAVTGGERMSLTRLGDASLLGIAKATTAYYSAIVESIPADEKSAVSLDVRTSRSGIGIRSRPFIQFARETGTIPRTFTPAEMIKSALAFPALPLRVGAFASENDRTGNMRLVTAVEPEDPGVVLTSAAVGYFDKDGKLVGQTNLDRELSARPALATVVVPPGFYRVRVAAVDSTGRNGAADVEISATMTPAGPLRLSSLVLGLWRDEAFQPRLQFSSEPVAIAYVEFAGGSAGAAVAAMVEISRTLGGPAIATTRLAVEGTSDPSRFTASGAIPIGGLPAGDYVVRATLGVEGQPAGWVARTLRKAGQ
jgi:hypothetical protein